MPEISVYRVAEEVRNRLGRSSLITTDEEVTRLCSSVIGDMPQAAMLTEKERARLVRLAFCALRCELEVLQDIASDSDVSEIMINGPDKIFIEKKCEIRKADVSFEESLRLERVIQRIAAGVGREINELNPIVDARLSDGSRINAVHSNIAIGGPILTIRRFNKNRLTMEELIASGDISTEASELLKKLVRCGYNMFVSGGTSSGKTTFLNVLSDFIPENERVIVIEDSAELQIRGIENLIRMETKNANTQGKGEVTIRDLIRTSLRMRPDRIIVGEVRGGEVVDMLAAMSTGHDGSLSTGHANSIRGMIGRLETMHITASGFPAASVQAQIAEAIEIFVHLARTSDGHRRVMEISELESIEQGEIKLNSLFRYEPTGGLVATGSLKNTAKLELKGETL